MNTAVVPQAKQSLITKFATKYSIEDAKLLGILKATAFKQKKDVEVSNEQMAALLVVADQYGLNPFTREIFAFPDKQNGIVPVVGVDGWSRIINDHDQSDGLEFMESPEIVDEHGKDHKPCPKWMDCIIYRKDRAKAIKVREYLDEVYRAPFVTNDGAKIKGPWQTHTKRMLRHKALIQAARIAYGFTGIYDEDEAQRIVEIDVTPVTSERSATAALKNALGEKPEQATIDAAAGEAKPEQTQAKPKPRGTPKQRKAFLAQMEACKSAEALGLVRDQAMEYDWAGTERGELEESYNALVNALGGSSVVKLGTDGTLDLRARLVEKIKAASTVDMLNESMDEANLYKWSGPDMTVLNDAFTKRREELSA